MSDVGIVRALRACRSQVVHGERAEHFGGDASFHGETTEKVDGFAGGSVRSDP